MIDKEVLDVYREILEIDGWETLELTVYDNFDRKTAGNIMRLLEAEQ